MAHRRHRRVCFQQHRESADYQWEVTLEEVLLERVRHRERFQAWSVQLEDRRVDLEARRGFHEEEEVTHTRAATQGLGSRNYRADHQLGGGEKWTAPPIWTPG